MIVLLSSFVYACTPTPAGEGDTNGIVDTPTVDTPAEASNDPMINDDGGGGIDADPVLESIRQEYARIQDLLTSGKLKQDSIAYTCSGGEVNGQLNFYRDASGVVLAVNGYSQGDHAWVTEKYYLRRGAPFFLFRELGYWSFGGPMQTLDDGTEAPGTIDKITEERYYFNDGATIKALTKAYEIRNDEAADPAKIPNETLSHNGEIPDGYQLVRAAIKNNKVDCSQLNDI